MTKSRRVLATRAAVVVIFLAFLEIAPRAGWVDVLTLIPLSEMTAQLWEMFADGTIWPHLIATGSMVAASFLLAVVTGLALGYLLWRRKLLYQFVSPYLVTYYALPIFAFYPVLIGIFGVNPIPIVLIAWAWAVVAVVVNTVTGFRAIPDVHHKTVAVYGLSRWEAFWQIYLPAAVPQVFSGVKLAITYSIIGVIASEFILATEGLGWLVAFNYNNFGLSEMYAGIMLVVVITMTITTLVGLVERRLVRG